MPLDIGDAPGATPLGPDELRGLKLTYILTQAELNAAEEANIVAAIDWTQRAAIKDILHRDFVLSLHRRMFGDVWRWAGTWRRRETNIGVAPAVIQVRLEALLRDARHWVANDTYPADELAVRLHHQMVFIHPFPNGNGRHTRLMADVLCTQLGGQPFSWGGRTLGPPSGIRTTYIDALRRADRGDLEPLVRFART